MIIALWLAGAQRNNFLTQLFHTLYVCGILYQMKLLIRQILTFLNQNWIDFFFSLELLERFLGNLVEECKLESSASFMKMRNKVGDITHAYGTSLISLHHYIDMWLDIVGEMLPKYIKFYYYTLAHFELFLYNSRSYNAFHNYCKIWNFFQSKFFLNPLLNSNWIP